MPTKPQVVPNHVDSVGITVAWVPHLTVLTAWVTHFTMSTVWRHSYFEYGIKLISPCRESEYTIMLNAISHHVKEVQLWQFILHVLSPQFLLSEDPLTLPILTMASVWSHLTEYLIAQCHLSEDTTMLSTSWSNHVWLSEDTIVLSTSSHHV